MRRIILWVLFVAISALASNASARFVSVDPVQANTKTGANFNRYHYANSNPYRFTDPDGRQAMGAPRDFYNPVTEDQARQLVPLIADFTPVVGDIKAGVEFVQNPTLANGAAAAVGLIPGVGDAAGKVIKGSDRLAEAGGKLFHYTDAKGAAGIAESGVIGADSRGRVFLTPDKISSGDANNALFMGQGGSKGTHVVEVDLRQGAGVAPGAQPNELIHQGSIRDGRQADIKVRENDF